MNSASHIDTLCVDPLCAQCSAVEQAAISNCGTDQSCITQAQAAYTACTANLAHDSQIESSRKTYKVLQLPPGLTASGSVTLQIGTAATSGPSDPAGGRTVMWTSTDPMNALDVFFWDESNQFTQPLRQILAQQSAKFVYRRVNSFQANAFDRRHPEQGAKVLNMNSATRAAQKGFAVVYVQQPVYSRNAAYATLGVTTPPTGNNGRPIAISMTAIRTFAANTRFPEATLVAQVVAHETGHRFGQAHPLRQSCCAFVSLSGKQLSGLTLSQVAFPGAQSKFLYVRLTRYTDPLGEIRIGDHLDLSSYGIDSNGKPEVQVRDATTPVYKVDLTGPIAAPATSVGVSIQQMELMDWTPNLNLTTPAQWHFDPKNLNNLCVRSVCQH